MDSSAENKPLGNTGQSYYMVIYEREHTTEFARHGRSAVTEVEITANTLSLLNRIYKPRTVKRTIPGYLLKTTTPTNHTADILISYILGESVVNVMALMGSEHEALKMFHFNRVNGPNPLHDFYNGTDNPHYLKTCIFLFFNQEDYAQAYVRNSSGTYESQNMAELAIKEQTEWIEVSDIFIPSKKNKVVAIKNNPEQNQFVSYIDTDITSFTRYGWNNPITSHRVGLASLKDPAAKIFEISANSIGHKINKHSVQNHVSLPSRIVSIDKIPSRDDRTLLEFTPYVYHDGIKWNYCVTNYSQTTISNENTAYIVGHTNISNKYDRIRIANGVSKITLPIPAQIPAQIPYLIVHIWD
jgi:hypothetical protein